MEFATNTKELKKLMIDKNIKTIGELAEKTGISERTVGKILAGTIQPSTKSIYCLINVLDISPIAAGEIFFASNLHKK